MARYIDADKIVSSYREQIEEDEKSDPVSLCSKSILESIIKDIERFPTADVEPAVRANQEKDINSRASTARYLNAGSRECWACKHHATGKCDTWCDVGEAFELREDIAKAKAEDVEPVIHAHWIHKYSYDGDKHTVCSRCGSDKYGHFNFPYCMDCGAKMDEVTANG